MEQNILVPYLVPSPGLAYVKEGVSTHQYLGKSFQSGADSIPDLKEQFNNSRDKWTVL